MAEIVELAQFALAEHKKRAPEHKNLVFEGVVYDIVVVVSDGGQKKLYEAKVAVDTAKNSKELKSFNLVGIPDSKPAAGVASVSL